MGMSNHSNNTRNRTTAIGSLLATLTTTQGIACASISAPAPVVRVEHVPLPSSYYGGGETMLVVEASRLLFTRVVCGLRGGDSSSSDQDDKPTTSEEVDSNATRARIPSSLKEMFSKFLDAIGALLGIGNSDSGPKVAAGVTFKQAFEAKYGKRHPRFSEKSLREATEQAWSRNQLCLVYITADRGDKKGRKVDEAICKALSDPQVSSFVDANFIMWVPKGKGKAQRATAAAASRRVGARSLPFLGVVHTSSSTDKMTLQRKLKLSTAALHHCNPPPPPKQMIGWMTRVLDLQKGPLEVERAEQQVVSSSAFGITSVDSRVMCALLDALQKNREGEPDRARLKDEETIHTERVEGYSRSLKDDALREVREAEEEAERARLQEEELRMEEARKAKEEEDAERRARKANELGTEPAAGATAVAGEEVSTLMLRLADGTRVRRRFQRSDAIGKVLDWADVQGVDLDTQRLSCSFPKASFSYPEDSNMSINETGLGKQTLLFVEQKPNTKKAAPDSRTESGETVTSDGDREL